MKRDYTYLEPYQYKKRLATEEIKRLNGMIEEWNNEGLSENKMIGMVMVDTGMSPNTCRAIVRSALLTKEH
jgi:cob(I)alamin adenosyltransferase